MHIEPFAALCIGPAGGYAPARKYQSMRPVAIEDGQFDIAVDWCGRYGVPHFEMVAKPALIRIEIYQSSPHRSSRPTKSRLRRATSLVSDPLVVF